MTPSPEPPLRNLTSAIVPALAAAALAGLGTLFVVSRQGGPVGEDGASGAAPAGCALRGVENFGGPIDLVDVNGMRVTQADFSGEAGVVYFGFTHCPDICPTTLYDLGEALRAPGGYDVQPIFITLDPERDTPDVMKQYAASEGFPAGPQGLTGTPAQVAAAAEAFRVSFRKAPIAGDAGAYNVDHTSLIYIMNPDWTTAAAMTTIGQSPQDIAACISAALSPRG